MKKALKMAEKDNVATVLSKVEQGEEVKILSPKGVILDKVLATQTIPFGFKISLDNISKDENIYKYGALIGKSYCEIKKGEAVHIHNIESNRINIPRERIDIMVKDMGL